MSTPPPATTLPVERVDVLQLPADLKRLQEQQALSRLTYPDGHVGWLITNYDMARRVLSDLRFSSQFELQRDPTRPPRMNHAQDSSTRVGAFIVTDPPEHTRYRRLLARHFTARRVSQLRPWIEQIVAEQLDAMEEAGPPADLVELIATPIPTRVISHLVGVPYADRATWLPQDSPATQEESDAVFEGVSAFILRQVQRKREDPGDDLLSVLIRSGELTDEEVAGAGVVIIRAGQDTTKRMLALGTMALLQYPELIAALRGDPALVDAAVEELLRYLSVTSSHTRTALEDVELDGHLIKAGDAITVSLSAANRDPASFDSPDELDIARSTSSHVAFGHGIHMCLGQHLARLEMQVAYPALFRRFPHLRLAVPLDQVPARVQIKGEYRVDRLPVAW